MVVIRSSLKSFRSHGDLARLLDGSIETKRQLYGSLDGVFGAPGRRRRQR